MPFEFKDFNDTELYKMRQQIDKEIQKRADEEKRKVIDEACMILKKVDSLLQRTITVEVPDPYEDYTSKVDVELDLLNLCQSLRTYRP